MTTSWPAIAVVRASRSLTSPSTTSSRGSSRCVLEVPPPPGARSCRRRVTRSRRRVGEQPVDDVAADEAGAADDDDRRRRGALNGRPGDRLPLRRRAPAAPGGETSRCQTTAHRPSVCGVMRSGDQRRDDDARRRRPARCSRRRGRRCRRPSRPRSLGQLAAPARCSPTRSARRRRRRRRRPAAPSLGAEPRASQPRREGGVPALVVGAGGQLGDVVGRRVGLERRRSCGSR